MATLVKLNSIASASLVKVEGIAMAGISKILSQTYSGGGGTGGSISITIPSADIASTLTNFPLCVYLTSANASAIFTELAGLDGLAAAKKLLVRESDDTPMSTEVDVSDVPGGEIILHTLVPSVSSSSDTTFYIDYDSAAADNDDIDAVGTVTGQAVWDANFLGVWHCNEDPSTTNVLDSTATNDLIPDVSMTTEDLITSPPGKGLEFDGLNDHASKDAGTLPTDYPFTMECAAKALTGGAIYSPAFSIADASSASAFFALHIFHSQTRAMTTSAYPVYGTDSILASGTFCHLATVHASTTSHAVYTNGADEQSIATSVAFPAGLDRMTMGAARDTSPGYWAGQNSEVRLSDSARSIDWLKATYDCLNGSLLTVSAPL